MLVRAYRLTDRFGVVLIKCAVALTEATLAGLTVVRLGMWAVVRGIWAVIGGILGVIAAVIALIVRIITPVFRLFGAGMVALSRRAAVSAGGAASGVMARRAARAEITNTVAPDPLRLQNRVLSILVIVLGFIVLGVLIWATDPSRNASAPVGGDASGLNPVLPVQSGGQPATTVASNPLIAPTTVAALPTAVPTATGLPGPITPRGTIAFVVREKGQTDVWAVPVGSRTALRLTNSPSDDRDPAWSPDGTKLAYASHQDGNWEIYVYDLNSGKTARMTYDLSFQGGPSWSPDGEWLAYESYQGNNLDVYVMRIDGSQAPLRLTDNAAPDFSPAWSPDGRTIAFVSWRDGNEDIYTFSLDNPRDDAVVDITNTPDRQEEYPSWSPDGKLIAYSALDEGLEKVFVKQAGDPSLPPQVLVRGRAPTWSPDGASLVLAEDSVDSTHLVAEPFSGAGVGTEIIPVPAGSTHPVWTSGPLPAALVRSGGLPPGVTEPLYVEQVSQPSGDPPYRLKTLTDVKAPNAVLSERVNDSFSALRERSLSATGWDFLGNLEDAFWQINRPPQPGEDRHNWLMTGRSFAINRNAIVGFPAPIEVVREDVNVNTYWSVYVRVADNAQSGQLGEPLRRMPWDFASRNQGDVQAYDEGGRLRAEMPVGYYVDLTQIAEDYGWDRVPSGSDWRANFNSTNYWLFQKRDGLVWYDAMRELYTEGQLAGFVQRPATPAPGELREPITGQNELATQAPVIGGDGG